MALITRWSAVGAPRSLTSCWYAGSGERVVMAAMAAIIGVLAGCAGDVAPPSILVFVSDTTRADAVSAYGKVRGTTPTTDALAASGLRYTRAYAQAPWTLPSHATLFTGLLPSRHGVSWSNLIAPDTLVTLAERLREAGYETVGMAENPWLSSEFNMTQGFERFVSIGADGPDLHTALDGWLSNRKEDDDRPFFLFVNVLDAHTPWKVSEENPFLPPGVTPAAARAVKQWPNQHHFMCSAISRQHELSVLWGLYLGGVAAADAKLGRVLERIDRAGFRRDLVTIVTSDHGEHFGEHRLVGHQFSVREPLVHVPLVVHGLAAAPAVIDIPVQVADIVPTVLDLAGVEVPDHLDGRPLPTTPSSDEPIRAIIAEHDDLEDEIPQDEPALATFARHLGRTMRSRCSPDDRVFGMMRAITRYPWKLVWFSRYPSELYNLDQDPDEQRNLADTHAAMIASLMADLEQRLENDGAPGTSHEPLPEPPSDEMLQRLRAMGYVGEDAEGEGGGPGAPSGTERGR